MKLTRLWFIVSLGAVLGVSSIACADDTDIYLTPSTVSRDDSPNVLIILDNSGSMRDQVQNAAPYDPTTTYTYGGSGTAFDPNLIYWKNNSSQSAVPTSATTYANQSFSIANNHCRSSTVPNAYSAADPIGTYTDQAASWNTTTGWQPLTTTDLIVECKADDNTSDNGSQYARANKSSLLPSASPIYASSNKLGGSTYFSGFPSYTFYSGNYLNYLNSTGGTPCTMGGTADAQYNYTLPNCPSKLQVAKSVVNNLVDSNPNVRFGMMNYNYDAPSETKTDSGGRVTFKIQDMNATTRASLHNVINSLTPSTNTPLTETLYEAYRYLSGQAVYYGNSTNPTAPAKDTSAQNSSGNYISPFGFSCQQAYIILVTDGDPTLDQNADSLIKALPGIGTPTNTIHDIYSGKDYLDYLDVLAGWMYNNDLYSAITGTQRAITYTIGFNTTDASGNTGISAQGLALLQSTADLGQGKAPGKGLFFQAANANELTTALQGTLIDIQTTTSSFAAPALSVNAFNRLFNRDDVYFAMFKPSSTREWDGNVKKFKLNTTGDIIDANGVLAIDTVTQRIKDTAQSYWSATADGGTITKGGAGSLIPAPSSRTVYTYTGTYPIGVPVDLSATANLLNNANTAITAAMLGLPGTATSQDRTDLINWIRGQDSYNAISPTNSRWAFSDPLHSRPVAITFGGTNTAPVIKLFVGTNDGVVHMINDKTGVEEWAFIPPELLSQQYSLSQDDFGGHPYGMDGTPTFWVQDTNNNGIIEPSLGDKIYMYIGMRRGGRNIYAFDVTPTTVLSSPTTTGGIVPKLLWVIRGGIDADYLQLGYTWSKPAIAQINMACKGGSCQTGDSSTTTVLIFGGGYDPHQDNIIPTGPDYSASQQGMGNAIYIVNPTTGQRIWWASGGPDSAGISPTLTLTNMSYSIPADLTLVDSNGDGAVDRIFAADTGGEIWRIDLSATLDVDTNAGTRGYALADISCPTGTRPSCTGTADQDRRKFFYPPDYVQVTDSTFSSIPDYDILTIESGDREDPLDQLTVSASPSAAPVHNRIYVFRDYNIKSYAGTTVTLPSPLREANLYDATADVLQNTGNAGYSADLSVLKAASGWRVDLKESGTTAPAGAPAFWPWIGEKGLAKTTIYQGVVYATTYTPPSDETAQITCSKDEGLGTLWVMNILNGDAVYDYNHDGTIAADDRHDTLGGGIPSELVVVIRDSGVSGLVGTSGGAAKPEGIPSGSPRSKTYWYQE